MRIARIIKSTLRGFSALSWLGTLYVLLLAFWLLVRVLFFDHFWSLALINTVAEYLFLPLPLLLIVCIWKQHWFVLLGLVFPISILGVLFGELFLPPFNSRNDTGRTITAMSFNILYENQDYEAIVKAIRGASPDIVGLQELTPPHAAALANALQGEYPYHTLQPPERIQGVGLVSRFPIETNTSFPLPPMNLSLHATLRIDSQRLHVFVVHLSPNNFFGYPASQFVALAKERYARRAAEVTRLEQEIRDLDEPVILLCDCNLTDTSEAYAHLDTFLNDSFREAGWGLGHTLYIPSFPIPVQRLDYVWHSDELVAIHAAPGQDGGSDHLPVVAKLRYLSPSSQTP